MVMLAIAINVCWVHSAYTGAGYLQEPNAWKANPAANLATCFCMNKSFAAGADASNEAAQRVMNNSNSQDLNHDDRQQSLKDVEDHNEGPSSHSSTSSVGAIVAK